MRIFGAITAMLAGWAFGCGGSAVSKPPTVADTLAKYSFREMTPPSTLFPPGSLVAISSTATTSGPTMDLICSARDVLGADPTLYSSESANSSAAFALSGSFGLGADIFDSIKADVRFNAVQDVKINLSNTRLVTLAQGKLFEAKPANYCIAAVQALQWKSLYIITSVLAADVDFALSFESGVSLDAQAVLTKELTARLSGGFSTGGGSQVSGKGLYWGERGDPKLVDVIFKNAKPQPPPPSVGSSCKEKDAAGYCLRCEVTAKDLGISSIGEGQSAMGISCTGMKPGAGVEIYAGGKVWPVNNGLNPNNKTIYLVAKMIGTAGAVGYSRNSHPNHGNLPFSATTNVPDSGTVDAAITVVQVQTWPNEHGPLNLDQDFKLAIRNK